MAEIEAGAELALRLRQLADGQVPDEETGRSLVRACCAAYAAGSVPALLGLGLCLERGAGVPRCLYRAFVCYLAAARMQLPEAWYEVGRCCEQGLGVERCPVPAVDWYRRAANQGIARAQVDLARCAEWGIGMPPDAEEATFWYRMALAQGVREALPGLARAYLRRWAALSPGSEEQGRCARECFSWYRRAAEAGFAEAQAGLGLCFECGIGCAVDVGAAAARYEAAARAGSSREAVAPLAGCD